MAQQVERFTRNEQVGGSNPPTSSKRPKRDKRLGLFRFLFFSPALPFFLFFPPQSLFYKKVYKIVYKIMYKIMYKTLTEKPLFGIIIL